MFDILLGMGKVKVCIVLREDILDGFKSRGLTNLSGVIEELLSAFLSSLPPEYRRRGAKETRELARRFLEGRPVQESPSGQQELLQQLMTLLQTLQTPSQPSQTFRPQPSPQPQQPHLNPNLQSKSKSQSQEFPQKSS